MGRVECFRNICLWLYYRHIIALLGRGHQVYKVRQEILYSTKESASIVNKEQAWSWKHFDESTRVSLIASLELHLTDSCVVLLPIVSLLVYDMQNYLAGFQVVAGRSRNKFVRSGLVVKPVAEHP